MRGRMPGVVPTYLLLLALLITSGAVSWLRGSVQFTADIMATLPTAENALIARADEKLAAQFSQQAIISVAGPAPHVAASQLSTLLTRQGFEQNSGRQLTIDTLSKKYAPYSQLLTTNAFSEALSSKQAMRHFFTARLSQPSPFTDASIVLDPTLNTATFLQQQFSRMSNLVPEQGHLVLPDQTGTRAFLFFTWPGAKKAEVHAFSTLADSLEQLSTQHPEWQLRYSGAPFHNAENTTLAKREMGLFSLLSLILLVLLLRWAFCSLSAFVYAHITVLAAIAAGLSAQLLIFTSVHVLSLVFGVTLIGIAIDYTLHVMSHQPRRQLSVDTALCKALTLGMLTTLAGYGAFLFAGVPMLTQVTVFVVTGLLSAWGFAVTVLPRLQLRWPVTHRPAGLAAVNQLSPLLKTYRRRATGVLVLLSAASIVTLVIAPPALLTNPAVLNASSDTLKNNEQAHYQLLNQNQHQILLTAPDMPQYLQTEEAFTKAVLQQLPDAQVQGVSNWLPALQTQQQNQLRWQQALQHGVFSSITDFVDAPLPAPPPGMLTLDTIQGWGLGPLVNSRVDIQDDVLGMLTITTTDAPGLTQVLARHDAAHRYEKLPVIKAAMHHLMQQTGMLALIALLAISLLIAVTQGAKAAWRTLLILLNITAVSLLFSAAVDGGLTLFHLLALMLVIALAADYLIFFSRHGYAAQNLFAIVLSALTSMAVFGILIFSQTPAIHALGLTALTGILMVLLLTPLVVKDES